VFQCAGTHVAVTYPLEDLGSKTKNEYILQMPGADSQMKTLFFLQREWLKCLQCIFPPEEQITQATGLSTELESRRWLRMSLGIKNNITQGTSLYPDKFENLTLQRQS